ncbi:hypothetical protein OMAG_000287 [Candidatus Omnitrophus magneticus]|uniref:Uncharacterized protein n=1 Tax=Candidatus Omnitrophus magneticus TaxID=1609969 RepID=A0A0F0CUZ9_9BACT|nr:hypothetical protein OMAG_000287 [Candidatus Omnitrophus magneticus]
MEFSCALTMDFSLTLRRITRSLIDFYKLSDTFKKYNVVNFNVKIPKNFN